jgi:hypothetical protein
LSFSKRHPIDRHPLNSGSQIALEGIASLSTGFQEVAMAKGIMGDIVFNNELVHLMT